MIYPGATPKLMLMTSHHPAPATPDDSRRPVWWEIEAARERVISMIPPTGTEVADLVAAGGRILADDLRARVPLPGFDNSAMDGYALGAGSLQSGTEWMVVAEQPAGPARQSPGPGPGEAWRIFTGAPLPPGATAVVMQEDTEPLATDRIRLTAGVEPGEFIRRAGTDLCPGQWLLRAGRQLTARDLGLLASQGLGEVTVRARPRLAVLTTGDECRPVGATLALGEIHESNGVMLAAMAQAAGAELLTGPQATWQHVGDARDQLRAALRPLLDQADMVVVSGGVSVGDHDHVRPVLQELGCESDVWRLRMKPGKPFVFASHPHHGARVFGLPGNPVSSAVTFHLLVAPAIRAALGQPAAPPEADAIVAEPMNHHGDRPHYLRVRVTEPPATGGPPRLLTEGRQTSDSLSRLARSDGLLRIEAGQTLTEGESVRWLPWPAGI